MKRLHFDWTFWAFFGAFVPLAFVLAIKGGEKLPMIRSVITYSTLPAIALGFLFSVLGDLLTGKKWPGDAHVKFLAILIVATLLMMLFAVAEFSLIFARWQTITNAAREGARTAVVFRKGCDVATVEAEVRQRVKDYAAPVGIILADADITVSGVCGTTTTNSTVTVTVPYSFRVLDNLAPSLSPTINTTGSSVMRNEGTS